jgi:hypothetical protein
MPTFWLLLMIFVPGVSPSIQHVGNFSSADACASAASETGAAIADLRGSGVPNATFRTLCVRASDGKVPAPN